jgi:hypothetical protein
LLVSEFDEGGPLATAGEDRAAQLDSSVMRHGHQFDGGVTTVSVCDGDFSETTRGGSQARERLLNIHLEF